MKLVSLLLVSLLVWNEASFAGQAAPTMKNPQPQTQETPQGAKIKEKVEKRGIGETSRVRVKLVNGAEVKGYISKIEEVSFTVADKKTGRTIAVPYADVRKIRGPGMSKGGKIALVAVAVGVVVLVAIGVAVGHAD